MSTTPKNKPAATLRDGKIKATIWKNQGKERSFHSVDFSRTWKDAEGNFQNSTSFSGVELLRVGHLAIRAYDELAKLRSSEDEEPDTGE